MTPTATVTVEDIEADAENSFANVPYDLTTNLRTYRYPKWTFPRCANWPMVQFAIDTTAADQIELADNMINDYIASSHAPDGTWAYQTVQGLDGKFYRVAEHVEMRDAFNNRPSSTRPDGYDRHSDDASSYHP